MRFPLLFVAFLAFVLTANAAPLNLREKTVSASRQIQVYSVDVPLRSRVASFSEDLKSSLLTLLGESDRWKFPVIVTLEKATPDQSGKPPVKFSFVQVEEGFKVEINVYIGDNPAEVNLQKHLLHAFLLEIAYRDKPEAVRGGVAYTDVPWWMVEGALQMFRKNEGGVESDVFKRIIDTNKLPSLEELVADRREGVGTDTIQAIDQACAMCLLQLLIDQPSGKPNLGRYLRRLPDTNPDGDRVAALVRDFPSLNDKPSLRKQWTLTLARFSAADRYQGLTPEETDAQLVSLLQFEIPTGKGTAKKSFGIGDFEEYLKLPASRGVLGEKGVALLALSTHASALYRSVLLEYQGVFTLLMQGKQHGIKDRLAKVDRYRSAILKRTSDIADYMNWFEATQMQTRSDSFDGYMNAAKVLDEKPKRSDPISQYLDEIAGQL